MSINKILLAMAGPGLTACSNQEPAADAAAPAAVPPAPTGDAAAGAAQRAPLLLTLPLPRARRCCPAAMPDAADAPGKRQVGRRC
jgi:hypothetical protein